MRRIIRRGVPIAAIAVVLSCGFALAGVFSSRISNSNANEVLLAGGQCGRLQEDIDGIDTAENMAAYKPVENRRYKKSLAYAQSCYQNSSTDACNMYVTKRLPLIVDRNASCPFGEDVCQMKFGNLQMDTGYIDTHKHLGMNARPQDRFSLRLTTHCAPLKTEGFSETVNTVNTENNQTVRTFRLNYGALGSGDYHKNYTYQFPINQTTVWLDSDWTNGPSHSTDYTLGYVLPFLYGKQETTDRCLQDCCCPRWTQCHRVLDSNATTPTHQI